MGYHIDYTVTPPVIRKDGGTGAWREAKKLLRQWYLEQASELRSLNEKTYFQERSYDSQSKDEPDYSGVGI